MTASDVKERDPETFTSKYSSDPLDSEPVVGFEPYLATVTAPMPVACAVTFAVVVSALTVPVRVVEEPLAWLVDVAGGGGIAGKSAASIVVTVDPGVTFTAVADVRVGWWFHHWMAKASEPQLPLSLVGPLRAVENSMS